MLSPALNALNPATPVPANPAPGNAAPASDDAARDSFAERLQQARAPQASGPRAAEAADARKPGLKKADAKRSDAQDTDEAAGKAEGEHAKPSDADKAGHDGDGTALDQLLPGWMPGVPPATAAEGHAKSAGVEAGNGKDAAGADALEGTARGARRPAAKDSAITDAPAKPGKDTAPVQSFADAQSAVAANAAAAKSGKDALPAVEAKAAATSPIDPAVTLASGAPQANTGAQAASPGAAAAAPFDAHLSAALGSADFAPALGVQVSVLVREGVQEARLHLNPADMGPIAVQIAVDGQNARVHFQADVPATREALQNSLPDLAAALHDSGFTLSGGGVSDSGRQAFGQSAGQGDAQQAPAGGSGHGRGSDAAGPAPTAAAPARTLRRQGVVDLYA